MHSWKSRSEPFAAAVRGRNPKAEVFTDPADHSAVDVLVTDDLDLVLARPDAGEILAAAATVTAAVAPAGFAALDARLKTLTGHGFAIEHLHSIVTPVGYFDDLADNLAPAWREGRLAEDATVETLVVD